MGVVNPIPASALKTGEYYWLHAPAIMCDDDPIVAQFSGSANNGLQDRWFAGGTFYVAGPGITPISHIRKPQWKPK